MSASRVLTTEWPMPAEARTTTDSVITARTAQRGRFLRTGRAGGRRGRCWGLEAGDRGGVGGKAGHLRATAVRGGAVSTVGPYDLWSGAAHPAGREGVPRSR
ncbi:hypothetical protein GCM10010251_19520 [Streptomyces aurantiogriseus]|uniref:Uncharacterized protein n=1 Tax=Streptomyces aurantiogriseus TaxID=66870 RepID=A0A918F5X4_9ACTN|nr:hypothetical protein GCM10010251_19520 [Streptomyces aurantiogriseus]